MKLRVYEVTNKNIKSLYGQIYKFLKNSKCIIDYTSNSWKSREPNSSYKYMSFAFKMNLIDDMIEMDLPIRLKIKIGDKIHFSGDRIVIRKLIPQYDKSIYRAYYAFERDIPSYEEKM